MWAGRKKEGYINTYGSGIEKGNEVKYELQMKLLLNSNGYCMTWESFAKVNER